MRHRRIDDTDLPTSVLLRDYPIEMVRLACTRCQRRVQYRKAMWSSATGRTPDLVESRRKSTPSLHPHREGQWAV
jgi:hypothetical protein